MKVLVAFLLEFCICSAQFDGATTEDDLFDTFDELLHHVMDVGPHVPDPWQRQEVWSNHLLEDAHTGGLISDNFAARSGLMRFPMGMMMFPMPSLMGNLFQAMDSLFSDVGFGSFEIPNVTLSDAECLITVDLKDLDVNATTFKIYGSIRGGISVEINTVKESSIAEEDVSSEMVTGDLAPKSPFKLRGAVSSMTTVRSFPTPKGCGIDNASSKATINETTNQLLIKLPKLDDSQVQDVAEDIKAQSLSDVPKEDAKDVASAPIKSSWLSRLFGLGTTEARPTNVKVQVPIVKYDEF
eukprot:Blabericola_migrator_1__1013@NODE_1255_length_4973_cov_202_929066_g848_i0_p2_GENE_NODE_1255_length_4973_cov_202_929066_g848_i0NODE_1255_length_4973_cov_202_929066_g848_i0_p2_ORF_typecomplete_len297_score58_43_NODE_1255_length_4973_cov_202_929066_g848_i01221012